MTAITLGMLLVLVSGCELNERLLSGSNTTSADGTVNTVDGEISKLEEESGDTAKENSVVNPEVLVSGNIPIKVDNSPFIEIPADFVGVKDGSYILWLI